MASEGVSIRPEVLKALRTTLGMTRPETVQKLFDETGLVLKQHSLYQIENGRRNPSPRMFLALCKVLGVDEDRKQELLASPVDRFALTLRK